MVRFTCHSPTKIMGISVYEMARRKVAIVEGRGRGEEGEGKRRREGREESNKKWRQEKERRKGGEDGNGNGKAEEGGGRGEERVLEEVGGRDEEGGCEECRSGVVECVYLCQEGHLHRDLPGQVRVLLPPLVMSGPVLGTLFCPALSCPVLYSLLFLYFTVLSCLVLSLSCPAPSPPQGCRGCGRRGQSGCKSRFMRCLRLAGAVG